MATVTAEAPVASVSVAPVAVPPKPLRPWVLGRWVDLFFIANLAWPLIVLAAVWSSWTTIWGESSVVKSLSFWQIYFISTPHRWITLALVFFDEDRFKQRPRAFVGIGLFFIVVVAGVVLCTGTTLLLVAIDYFWNSWHFAAQHSGISRIYARQARPEEQTRGWWEKILLRAFILFVILRAGALSCAPNCLPHETPDPLLGGHLNQLFGLDVAALTGLCASFSYLGERWLDVVMLIPAILLIGGELLRFRSSAIGRVAYLGSVIAIYTTALLACHYHLTPLLLGTLLAIALFHATEYMAIVSWAVIRKGAKGGTLGRLVPRWTLALALFMGVLAISAWAMDTHMQREWAVLTIAVSFLHYAYDGMIWKARKPAAAPVVAAPAA
jgi:hypothetical protein